MTTLTDRLSELSGREQVALAPRATTALVAVLRALELPPSSEVLMPAMMCANPANAVRWAGLCSAFADVSPRTFNLDLDAAGRVVGRDTRVLLAVPLFGHPLDVPALLDFAELHDLILIEDAAQAVGLRYEDEPAGSLGLCSVFSFGEGKIADAGGGAAILSDDPRLMDCVRSELAKGRGARHDPATLESRICSALDRLPEELEARGNLARLYRQELRRPGLVHPDVSPGAPLWKYSVLLPNRDERDRLTRALLAAGVEATNLYPPLSRFVILTGHAYGAQFPAARDVSERIINLPLWPQPPGLLEKVVGVFEGK